MSNKGTLRCLSIRNPWAWTICLGVNTAENRVWSTDHRGTIAIHTGVSKSVVNRIKREDDTGGFLPELFQFGMIIGLADVDDVVEYGPSLHDNPWASGPYCWLMSNGRFLKEPVPLKGRLNLFYLADDVAEQVLSQPTYKLDANEPKIRGCVEAICPDVDPGDRYLHLARHYLQHGELDQADEACDAGLRANPESGATHFFSGYVAYMRQDNDKALASFNTSLEKNDQLVDAFLYRGLAYHGLGELDLACTSYDAAIERAPTWAAAYICRAAVLNAQGEYSQAVQAATRALEHAPDDALALTNRAEARLGLGEFDQAIADATQALSVAGEFADALLIRGEAYTATGDTDAAQRDMEAADRIGNAADEE